MSETNQAGGCCCIEQNIPRTFIAFASALATRATPYRRGCFFRTELTA